MLKVATALTICYLFADLLSRLLKFFLKYFEKLTEITFHLLVCQIKSHFFLIPFLIFFYPKLKSGAVPSRRQPIHNTTPEFLCQLNFHAFSNFFNIFSTFFNWRFFLILSGFPTFLLQIFAFGDIDKIYRLWYTISVLLHAYASL